VIRATHISLLLVLLLALAGCATGPSVTPGGDLAQQAYAAKERGDYRAAAREFTRLAAGASAPDRQRYQLEAAEALFHAGLFAEANQLVEQLQAATLTPHQQMRLQLLQAQNALRQHDPDQALNLLAVPAAPAAEADLLARYHELRAHAFARLGNHLESAHEYVERERFLSDPDMIEANQTAIWDALSLLSDPALAQLQVVPPPDTLSGWIALVRIAKGIGLKPEEVAQRIAEWRQSYPDHPALDKFVDAIVERSRELRIKPKHIALLLPLTGHFAEAGATVRDGILTAYYGNQKNDPSDSTIRVYDTGPNPNRVLSAYDQAIADGAEFVVGPLDRKAVGLLAQRNEIPVPTLALNNADIYIPPHKNFYQFALSPEDEAKQVAERTWLDGSGRAAVLVPKGDWGDRVRYAYDTRWDELGGDVVVNQSYDPKQSDFSDPLRHMLNLDQSDARRRDLERMLGRSVEFTPRRRQDIDFVFLAAFPRQARLIRPQLRFHHAAHLPVYATSHVFSGKVDANQDRDMDGIIFGGMPWTLDAPTPNDELRNAAAHSLPSYDEQWQRLIAMGVDAYHLLAAIKLLHEYPHERYQGETGSLRVDDQGRVRRQLVWARFVGGVPHLIKDDEPTQARAH
jgi:outer membrane PBP1 activator LpoA protein